MRLMKRFGMLAAATAAAGLLLGCDAIEGESAKADRSVSAHLEQATRHYESRRDDAREAAMRELEQAVGETNATPALRVQARNRLAQTQEEAARELLNEAAAWELEADRLIWEMAHLGEHIRFSNLLVEEYRQRDPESIREALAERIAEVRGDNDRSAWFDHQGVQIPTLSSVRQEISRLQGDIANVESQIEELRQQRRDLLNQAEDASQLAEQADGQEAVDAYHQASNLRRQASDLNTEVGTLDVQLTRLQRDLSIVDGQQRVVTRAIQGFEALRAQIDEGWEETEQQIQAVQRLVRRLAEGETDAEVEPVAVRLRSLEELIGQIDANRQTAIDYLERAVRNYADAAATAHVLNRELTARLREEALRDLPQRSAWEARRQFHNPPLYELRQANAQQALATVYAAEATSFFKRLSLAERLAAAYEGAGLSLPAGLSPGELAGQLQQAHNRAESAYDDADALLDAVAESPQLTDAERNMLRVARIFTLYGWAQLSSQAGDDRLAQDLLAQAIAEHNAAREAGQTLPRMPAELVR